MDNTSLLYNKFDSVTFDVDDSMPTFKDLPSPRDKGDIRIQVAFSNFVEDILILTQVPGTSIFEGHLQDDYEVPVVLIDTPSTKKRLVSNNICNDVIRYE